MRRTVLWVGNSRKTGKEQYYTPPMVARALVGRIVALVDGAAERPWVEPAAGTGSFVGAIEAAVPGARVWAVDLEPKAPDIEQADFLEVAPPFGGGICLTNPPFGRNHSLSVPFFNHAAAFCDYVGFIVPRSWRKWSIVSRLEGHMHLLHDEDLEVIYEDAAGRPVTTRPLLRTVFQVWERRVEVRQRIVVPDRGYVKVVGPAEADVALTVFGRGCGTVRTEFERVENTTQRYLAARPEVVEALRRVDLSVFYTNVAYVEALSMAEINHCLNEYFDRLGTSDLGAAA